MISIWIENVKILQKILHQKPLILAFERSENNSNFKLKILLLMGESETFMYHGRPNREKSGEREQ